MKIGIIGTGYVGLVQGVMLADFGHQVINVDINEEKIEELKKGNPAIHEPGLSDYLKRNLEYKRIEFTTDVGYMIENSDIIFIAVGTPPKEDGSADLQYVLRAANEVSEHINNYKVVVNKSTVPVGTAKMVTETIRQGLEKRGESFEFDVISNPEFLREGKAIQDTLYPDRVVVGTTSERAREVMKKVYNVLFLNNVPFIFTNWETSEMIKYAANAFLAVKISFINEMALLAEKVGANVQEIAHAMGKDGRISPKFLHAGPGYGGSCFPKDTKAIVNIANSYGEEFQVIKAAISANEKQKKKMVEKIINAMGSVKGKTLAILGLSFKPETDDVRDAPSLDIISGLVEAGAKIKAYCPKGIEETKWRLEKLSHSITYCENEYEAANETEALILMTEWHQFRGMDLDKIVSSMQDTFFFDLRNVYAKDLGVRELFKYYGVGI
ncbi:MAG: UDP-glucose/GDP-mannose dehydrogenase family protein [Fusobacteria bacterium]|nr:UDP-glucose/GDP-mannose dehydrogenase family protein [Fusobacteriota bacterium]